MQYSTEYWLAGWLVTYLHVQHMHVLSCHHYSALSYPDHPIRSFQKHSLPSSYMYPGQVMLGRTILNACMYACLPAT